MALKVKTEKAVLILKADPDCLCELGLVAACLSGAFGSRNLSVNEDTGTIRESIPAEYVDFAIGAAKAMMKELDIDDGSVSVKDQKAKQKELAK